MRWVRNTNPILDERARELRRQGTAAEERLWDSLRAGRRDGLKFRRQHAVGSFILDFYCPSRRLCVELDGVDSPGSARTRRGTRRCPWPAGCTHHPIHERGGFHLATHCAFSHPPSVQPLSLRSPLPRSWGRGRRPSEERATAGGGEGPPAHATRAPKNERLPDSAGSLRFSTALRDQAEAAAVISSSEFSSVGASVSMKELTENTALPGPGGPYPGGGCSPCVSSASRYVSSSRMWYS